MILLILSYLNLVSLVLLSRVCRRFHRLSRDVSAWQSVELTRASMGRRLNAVTLKRVIRTHLPPSLCRVTLEETNPRGNAVITEALIELLFNCCPKMESIALLHCDMKKVICFAYLFAYLFACLFVFVVCCHLSNFHIGSPSLCVLQRVRDEIELAVRIEPTVDQSQVALSRGLQDHQCQGRPVLGWKERMAKLSQVLHIIMQSDLESSHVFFR